MICIIINNIEGFFDTYEAYEDVISQITRDCLKYGIIFIITTNGPNTVRYRLRQNFRQNVVLQFNDPSDYSSVLPGVRKKEPSKEYGRGLISLDNIYEFQTSYPYKEEKMTDYIKIICNKLNEIYDYKAPKVPVLPEKITLTSLLPELKGLQEIPVGIAKEDLQTAIMSLKSSLYNITGEDISSEPKFIENLIKMILHIPNTNCVVLDAMNILDISSNNNLIYDNNSCNLGIEALNKYKDSNQNSNLICFIIGATSLFSKVDASEKSTLEKLLQDLQKISNARIIIADNINNIKVLNYDAWFKNGADLSEGIWLGNNIDSQFTMKVNNNPRSLRVEIGPSFGYIITKGKAKLIKIMTEE